MSSSNEIPAQEPSIQLSIKEQPKQEEQIENKNQKENEISVNSVSKPKSKSVQLKRPPNSYVLFCSDHRDEVQSKNPSFSTIQVSQTLSKMWKELDPLQAKKYKDRANELYNNFKQENPDYHYKNSKSPKKTTVFINRKDSFQVLNQLFQSSPFMFQQMLLEKDKKGNLDITKIFC